MVQVQEVGDGNINFVYIVKGPEGAVCLKQGLPFVRIAQDWPLTQVLASGAVHKGNCFCWLESYAALTWHMPDSFSYMDQAELS